MKKSRKQPKKTFTDEELLNKPKKISKAAKDKMMKDRLYEEYLDLYNFTLSLQTLSQQQQKQLMQYADRVMSKNGEINKLEETIETLERELEALKLSKGINPHNERKAGRKSRMTLNDKELIHKLYDDGNSLRKITEEVGFSLGTVQKVVREYKKEKMENLELEIFNQLNNTLKDNFEELLKKLENLEDEEKIEELTLEELADKIDLRIYLLQKNLISERGKIYRKMIDMIERKHEIENSKS